MQREGRGDGGKHGGESLRLSNVLYTEFERERERERASLKLEVRRCFHRLEVGVVIKSQS